jgi:hypothetical protein
MTKQKEILDWRCKSCKYRIAIDAYYCKKCGALVSALEAPDAREPDRTIRTRLRRLWYMRTVAKLSWGLIIVIAIASSSYFFNAVRQARTDNHSSAIFVMKLDNPSNPFQCTGPLCQVTVEITNKSKQMATLQGVPYFLLDNGTKYGPIDVKKEVGRLYFADKYCHQVFNLTFGPKESKKFLGICTENLPKVGLLKSIEIQDPSKKVVLSVKSNVSVPFKP